MATSNQHRHLMVISGKQSDCLAHAKKLTQNLDCLLLDEPKKAQIFLGQEFDAVIFDCHEGFDPNAFGAITGTIRGNGYLLLLKPEDEHTESLFLKRFWSIVAETDHQLISAPSAEIEALSVPSKITYATDDQSNAIDKIVHVVKGHRRRPLVITADRGRGKSAALGIAAAKLFDEGYKNIIICAPSKKMASIIFKHAMEQNPECHLAFYSPDELQQQKPEADLVLIDEAAAIPVSLLTDYLKHYSRIVFSTTQHGYEGSGRGFSIKFKKILESHAPEWVSCELHAPIRWNENDLVEKFVFDALLLNAEPADVAHVQDVEQSRCIITKLDKTALLKAPTKLSELFGLLVSAHYQTKPSDLMHLLDDDLVSIRVTEFEGQIIAVVLLIQEGGIEPSIATDIFEGTRRLQGHLVAQSLAANAGIDYAPCLRGERIIRIAVHPDLQKQGFGSALLRACIKTSKADYLSTSFGASTELLQFWRQLAFKPVYLGMKRDASSGTHSVVMLFAQNDKGQALMQDAEQRFATHFLHLLSEPFSSLESDLVLFLLSSFSSQVPKKYDYALKELHAFATKQRGYENTYTAVWQLVCGELPHTSTLTEDEKKILVLKVLQKHSWLTLSNEMGGNIKGKKDALRLLRKAVGKLL